MVTIQMDTREKQNKKNHILKYFSDNNINVVRSKLFVGDYTLLNKQDICIDVKQDCLELFMCLTKSHVRFRNEMIRAQKNGIQLIILIEEVLPVGGLSNWVSPLYKSTTKKYKKGDKITIVNPITMLKVMETMQKNYSVKFLFCDSSQTGKEIVTLLHGDTNFIIDNVIIESE